MATYGNTKTGAEWSDVKVNSVWVVKVRVAHLESALQKKYGKKGVKSVGVIGTVKGARKSNDIDNAAGNPHVQARTQTKQKYVSNKQYFEFHLSQYSIKTLYGEKEAKDMYPRQRQKSKYTIYVDFKPESNHPVEVYKRLNIKLPSDYFSLGVNDSKKAAKEYQKFIDDALADGPQDVSRGTSGVLRNISPMHSSGNANNKPKSNTKSKNSSGGNKNKSGKVTQQYWVTLSNGNKVKATISYTGPKDAKVKSVGAPILM